MICRNRFLPAGAAGSLSAEASGLLPDGIFGGLGESIALLKASAIDSGISIGNAGVVTAAIVALSSRGLKEESLVPVAGGSWGSALNTRPKTVRGVEVSNSK